VRLVRSYPHRWGEGKVHIERNQSGQRYDSTLCSDHVHGKFEDGKLEDVTCKKCLAMMNQ